MPGSSCCGNTLGWASARMETSSALRRRDALPRCSYFATRGSEGGNPRPGSRALFLRGGGEMFCASPGHLSRSAF